MSNRDREERPNGRRLEDWERLEMSQFKHPGDWWANEPPSVDLVGYRPDQAPYPHAWTSDMRVEMTWYAQQHNVRVEYDPDAGDEGASGWQAAYDHMRRVTGNQRSHLEQAREAIGNPDGALPLPAPEPPHVPDPGEPRHPRDEFAEW